ncbi:MAG: hypothetical protein ACYC91_05705 [Solirubrobacteraceae bacterium]
MLIAGIALVIDRQLAGKLHPDATTVGLVVVVSVLVVVLLYPRELERFLERVSNVKVAGFEVGLTQAERARVVDRLPPVEELETPIDAMKRTGTVVGDLYEVRKRLTDRLTWLGKELLPLNSVRAGDVLRWLVSLELVDADQARFVIDLLLPELSDLPSLSEAEQEKYIKRAWDFANRLRPNVFDREVRAEFRDRGWTVADFKQKPNHRADFLATTNNRWLLVAPRIALDENSGSPGVIGGDDTRTRVRSHRSEPGDVLAASARPSMGTTSPHARQTAQREGNRRGSSPVRHEPPSTLPIQHPTTPSRRVPGQDHPDAPARRRGHPWPLEPRTLRPLDTARQRAGREVHNRAPKVRATSTPRSARQNPSSKRRSEARVTPDHPRSPRIRRSTSPPAKSLRRVAGGRGTIRPLRLQRIVG